MQETAIAISKHIKNFNYDIKRGRFKTFLFRIVNSKVVDSFRRKRAILKLSDSELFRHTDEDGFEKPAIESVNIWEEEWCASLLEQSLAATRKRVSVMTFMCFEKTFMEDRPVGDVARELNIPANLVSQHKFKVLKALLETARNIFAPEIS